MVAKSKNSGVSLAPSAMYEGGGLLDDLNAVVEEAAFVMYDYNGKAPIPTPCAYFKLVGEDGESHDQYWSVGKDFAPSGDGSSLTPTGSATNINKGSNFGILMSSIVEAGFPENRLTDSIKDLEGMEAHFGRVAAPKRSGGITRAPRADGKEYEATILVVTKVNRLPWEKAAAKGKGKTTAPKGGASAPDEGDDEMLQGIVQTILLEKDGEVTKQQLASAAFQHLKDSPNRNTLVQRIFQDEFLKNGPWGYEKGVVSMLG